MEISTYFERLAWPSGEEADVFYAQTIPGEIGARVAVDRHGRPAVLIRGIPLFPLCNFRLKYLEVSVRCDCRVSTDGEARAEDFVAILLRTQDRALKKYFFSIITTFLSTLEGAHSNAQRELAYQSLLEIFRSLNDEPMSTIQGLWSELFVIAESQNIPVMVDAWHHAPGDRFDFTSGSERLEVKSSKLQSRVHTFAAFQLIPDFGTRITIASLFTMESSCGCSIQQLINTINEGLTSPEHCLKLTRIVARTLGRGIAQAMEAQFDAHIARSSLCFYDAADVPKIEAVDIPMRVSDVHFKSDLSNIRPICFPTIFISSPSL